MRFTNEMNACRQQDSEIRAAIHGAALRQFAEQEQQTASRQPQVAAAIERLDYCVNDLGSAMDALAARIDPVLRPDLRDAKGAESVPTPVRCQLADAIDRRSDMLCSITAKLRDMLSRLEV